MPMTLQNSQAAETLSTQQKALEVNLDPRRYGTFAEIGAGQEVVRWFFRVGGGAGTIAKSMSAYDMKVSDAIYGRAARYVCRATIYRRCLTMNMQAESLIDCGRSRGDTTAFFRICRHRFGDAIFKARMNAMGGWASSSRLTRETRTAKSSSMCACLMPKRRYSKRRLGIVGVNSGARRVRVYSHEPEMLVDSLLDGLINVANRNRHDRVFWNRFPPCRQPIDEPEAR